MDWGYILSVMVTSAFGVEAIVFGLAAIGINMQFGYTGLLNFGQSAFMAVGGYSVAVTVVELGLNFWVGRPPRPRHRRAARAAAGRADPAAEGRLPRHRHHRRRRRSSGCSCGR